MNADTLLEASVAFKNATKRTEPLQDSFATVDEAFETMKSVLMHEAKEEVERSSKEIPERLRFYSVDVGSATPGVFEDEETVVKRPLADISPLQYEPTALAGLKRGPGVAPPTFTRTPDEAVREASGRLDAMRAEEEKGSKRERAAERRAKKLGEESEGDRQARLQKAKEKRAERKRKKEAEGEARRAGRRRRRRPPGRGRRPPRLRRRRTSRTIQSRSSCRPRGRTSCRGRPRFRRTKRGKNLTLSTSRPRTGTSTG